LSFWNCSDDVVYFVFHFILRTMNASSYYLGVSRIRVAQSLDYCVEFCTSLFVVSRLYLICPSIVKNDVIVTTGTF
jgi:hypothetical protein